MYPIDRNYCYKETPRESAFIATALINEVLTGNVSAEEVGRIFTAATGDPYFIGASEKDALQLLRAHRLNIEETLHNGRAIHPVDGPIIKLDQAMISALLGDPLDD